MDVVGILLTAVTGTLTLCYIGTYVGYPQILWISL